MLTTILRSVIRQAERHPLYVALNVLGLALGIAVFLTLSLMVRYEYSYNSALPDLESLFRIDTHWTMPGSAPVENATVTFHALPFLREDFPEIKSAVGVEGTDFKVKRNGAFISFDGYMTDAAFFDVFPLKLAHGSATDALARPDGLVLSATASKRLFGDTDPMGKTVDINRNGITSSHVVTAVLAPQKTASFLSREEMLVPFSPENRKSEYCFLYWGSDCGSVYIKLRHKADASAISSRLRDFVIRRAAQAETINASLGEHPEKIYAQSLVPLKSTRFYDSNIPNTDDGVDRTVINSIGLIGILALALACANAVNLATARAALRAREVAIRKTLGATRHTLFVQFMGESILISSVAGAFGLALCEFLVPEVASLVGEDLVVGYGFTLAILPLIILACGFASGIYPSLILSGYRPAAVLAAARIPSGGRGAARLRDMLIVGQFGIAITIVICTLVINSQTHFLRNADQGYTKSGLLISDTLPTEDLAIQRKMLDTLRSTPGVVSATFSEVAPNPSNENESGFSLAASTGEINVHLLQDTVGMGYLDTYRPRLLAGRWFDALHGQDDAPRQSDTRTRLTQTILNASAASKFGFSAPSEAVGKILSNLYRKAVVIGVVDDLRFQSPRQPVSAEILDFDTLARHPFQSPVTAVRFRGAPESVMIARLNKAWQSVAPDIPGSFQSPDARMASYYRGDERRGHIFTLGAVAALLIACLGLYGLASFASVRRVHEIGIRKTLGATSGQIMTLMLLDFLRPVLLACVLACPVGWIVMQRWLQGFDERISFSPIYVLIAVAGAVAIAALTVLGQTVRVARSEPARALRAE